MPIHALPIQRLQVLPGPFIYDNGKGWRWQSSSRAFYNLWVCMEGRGVMCCDGREYALSPWSAFVLSPGMVVEGRVERDDESLKNFSVHWNPRETEVPLAESPLLGVRLHEVDTVRALIQALIRLSVFNDPLARQQVEWMVLQLLGVVWRETQAPVRSPVDRIIHRQLQRMRSGEGLFSSVDRLAEEAGLSRIHYGRRFRRIAGEAPNRFLIRQRMERACVLLKETNWTIESVATAIGYADVYFFSRQFRASMGVTPRRFRVGGLDR